MASIQLDYESLGSIPNEKIHATLKRASRTYLDYNLFFGDIILKQGEVNLSTSWLWIPLYHYARVFSEIVDRLKNGNVKEVYAFTENDEKIFFVRKGDAVKLTASYVPGEINTSLEELAEAVEALCRKLSADLLERHPELRENKEFMVIANRTHVYTYDRKDFLMTKAENDFFILLKDLLQDEYQIFPQMHLTALLDQRVKGQNWNAAFRHINGKSVDFVVCDKTYARPLLAIELDDWTHDAEQRRIRDEEVERIFKNADMPLLRIRDYMSVSKDTVAAQINDALRGTDK